jgi:uncharacterized protein (DUF2235 family)
MGEKPRAATGRSRRNSEKRSENKSIVLFSDGTGNSSAKLFKTNVWRMYEAVDLGPPAKGKRPQISYYDDGVGTSGFKPLAMLGGAFGWGLKRNVLDLYRYACRNYRDGDEIYGFGFSRGAFTMRLVISLIASQGLIPSDNEAELEWKSKCAFRAFRTHFLPRKLQWPTKALRGIRNWLTNLRGREGGPYDPSKNLRPTIRFIGVWDTVSAYGGPIAEITRAIDNWIYPLSMPNYELPEQVERARHALALDDERDAFQPLLWDEVHAATLPKIRGADRLQQVWFTGMHADVGGGYPDESLSYVSLLWMMEEAEEAGLRTLEVVKDRIVALASSYGPIHDSRAGLGAYYRYQPRKIAAWLDPDDAADPGTFSLRDPIITDENKKPKGLLTSVQVHESVIARIADGTDRYAPITLPRCFRVVPPQKAGENVPQDDSESGKAKPETTSPKPMVSAALRARLADPEIEEKRSAALERVWNWVWGRRITYFVTLAFTLLLLTMPIWVERAWDPPVLSDGRTWIGGIIRLLTLALPGFAGDWVEVYADNPFYFLLIGGIIILLLIASGLIERRLRDHARRVWKLAVDHKAQLSKPRRGQRLERFRNSRFYQRTIQIFKWNFLPDWVFAPLMALVLLWVGLAVFTQVGLPFLENGSSLCASTARPTAITGIRRDFSTRDVCSESYGSVVRNQRYIVTFEVVDEWKDSRFPTSPQGLSAGDLPWGLGYLAAPFRRVIDAGFLQPLIEVRPRGGDGNLLGNVQIYPLTLTRTGDSPNRYEAEFVAPRDGELFLFVNDSMLPLTGDAWGDYGHRYFYESSGFGPQDTRGNHGTACVTVEHADVATAPMGEPAATSICGKAAARAAALALAAQQGGAVRRSRGEPKPPSPAR